MTYNAADRKHVRAAEKALVQVSTINREVITGIMSVKNGRHWMWDQLSTAHIFTDPFNIDPHLHAYNAGSRAQAIGMFNDIILYAPKNFILMIEEAHERAATADAVRNTADRDASDGDAELDAAE